MLSMVRGYVPVTGHQHTEGIKLYPSFVGAGLPGPTMRLDAIMAAGSEASQWFSALADLSRHHASPDRTVGSGHVRRSVPGRGYEHHDDASDIVASDLRGHRAQASVLYPETTQATAGRS